MIDLLGEPTVADQLARDILMEAQAARGLSRVEEPNEQVIDWWSRRVYVTAMVLEGNLGQLLRSHRAELVPELESLLEDATTERLPEGADPDDPKVKPIPVPDKVIEASRRRRACATSPTRRSRCARPGRSSPSSPTSTTSTSDRARSIVPAS